jgi:polysaccharide pyruvyl transferase WcaK-like protein
MKIVISGGWGYGNLGDDAILDATVKQLRSAFPSAECSVLTFDTFDSAVHAGDSVSLHAGVHAFTDGHGCSVFMPGLDSDFGRLARLSQRLRYRVTESRPWFEFASRASGVSNVIHRIAAADLFVMSGGGYFNERWLNKSRAQLLEIRAAASAGVPFAVLGPTIGKFAGPLRTEIEGLFRQAKLVTVRDEFSFSEASQWHPNVQVIPDIALGTWLDHASPEDHIGVIFTSQDAQFRSRVASALSSFLAADARGLRVKLLLSRRWKYDLKAAIAFQTDLQRAGVASELVLPSSFSDLERCLSSCRMVISENLHGLILAARNQVPVVAVNDYENGSPNFKKFIAFLAQSESQDLFFNARHSINEIAFRLAEAWRGIDAKKMLLGKLRQRVHDSYMEALTSAFK